MNRYRVTTFSYGNSQAIIIEAFDMVSALQSRSFNQMEVVKIEFIGSANEVDMTAQQT